MLQPNHMKALSLSVIIAVLGYGLWLSFNEWQDIEAALQRIGVFGLTIILAASLVNYGLRFVRWHLYLKYQGHAPPMVRHSLIYIAGFSLTTTPGKAGEGIRSLFLKKDYNVPIATSLASLVTERLSDLLAMLLLAQLILTLSDRYQSLMIATASLTLLLIIILRSQAIISRLKHLINVNKHHLVQRFCGSIINLLSECQSILGHRIFYGTFLISLIAWGAEAFAFSYLVSLLGYSDISWIATAGIYSIAVIAGAISFLPGGLGSTEAVMFALLITAGVSAPDATCATIVCRLATLWFAVVLGVGALIRYETSSDKNQSNQTSSPLSL